MPPIDAIFDQLRTSLTASTAEKTALDDKVEAIRSALRPIHFQFSKIHSTPPSQLAELVQGIDLSPLVVAVKALHTDEPIAFHKYSGLWAEPLQSAIAVVLLRVWITRQAAPAGSSTGDSGAGNRKMLDLLEDPSSVSSFFGVPLSQLDVTAESALSDATQFHITIQNYLHAVLILCNELSRLAFNSVTTAALGNSPEKFGLPVVINKFLKEVQAAYLSLNLKNDSLRRRTDGLKYDVKTVEQIVYDLTLRELI